MREHTSFKLSDFFSYTASGAIALVLIYWFYINFLQSTPISSINIKINIVEFILFLATSYLLGHLLQSLPTKSIQARSIEQLEEVLRKLYTPEFKQEVERYIKRIFGLPKIYQAKQIQGSINEKIAQEKTIYYLCSSLIAQQNNSRYESFLSTLTLYQSIRNTITLGIFVSGAIVTKHFYLIYIAFLNSLAIQNSPITLPQIELYKFESAQFAYGAISFILFVFFLYLWDSRFKVFVRDYIDWVYQQFYVWYKLEGSRLNHTLSTNRLEPMGHNPTYSSAKFRSDD